MRSWALVISLLSLLGLSAGCSAIPTGQSPELDPSLQALAARRQPTVGRLGIAPLTSLGLSAEEVEKGWLPRADIAFRAQDFDRALEASLDASGSYERVRSMQSGSLGEAYTERDDFVLRVALKNLESRYEGRNGWWIPNIVNWLFWMVPAWWVATEDYALSAELELTLLSAESGAVLAQDRIEAEAKGSFDEFDRGWHFFGFVYTPLDPERWLRVSARLFPELRRQLCVQTGVRCDALLRKALGASDYQERSRKTLVTAIGVSRYSDAYKRPELPYAARDARALLATLRARGVDASRTQALLDGEATVARLRAALEAQLGRAREGDDLLVFFAGYGSRDAAGRPLLLFSDSDEAGGGALLLHDLLAELARYPGRKLLVVDAAFEGGRRSIAGPPAAPGEVEVPPGVSLLLSTSTGQPALALDYLGQGLLTHRLLHALSAPDRDLNGDGLLDLGELFPPLRAEVVAESALLGQRQEPRLLSGGGPSFSLSLPGREAQAP